MTSCSLICPHLSSEEQEAIVNYIYSPNKQTRLFAKPFPAALVVYKGQ